MLTAFGVTPGRFTPRLLTRLVAVLAAAIATAFVIQAPSASAAPTGYIHRSGTTLVDGQNRPFLMNSVNIGGYLNWEGWIFGGGPTSENNKILKRISDYYRESTITGPKTVAFQKQVRDKFITRADFAAMKSAGVNTVRVPINYRLLGPSYSDFSVLDRLVADAEATGVYLVFDLHSAPGSQNAGFISDNDGFFLNRLWATPAFQDQTVNVWRAIANQYKGRTAVAGYDLLNEPQAPKVNDTNNPDQNAALLNMYARIIQAIRSVDTSHLVIYEGNNLAHDFEDFRVLDPNSAVSFHEYELEGKPEVFIQKMKDATASLGLPLWNGEYGLSDVAWSQKQITKLNDANLAGQALWTWKINDFDYLAYVKRTTADTGPLRHLPPTPYKFSVPVPTASGQISWEEFIRYIAGGQNPPLPAAGSADQAIASFFNAVQFPANIATQEMVTVLSTGCKVRSSANCA